jgi:hypothetical protein
MGVKVTVPGFGGGPPENVTLPFTGITGSRLSLHPSAITSSTTTRVEAIDCFIAVRV